MSYFSILSLKHLLITHDFYYNRVFLWIISVYDLCPVGCTALKGDPQPCRELLLPSCSRLGAWGTDLATGAVSLLSSPSDHPCVWGTEQPERDTTLNLAQCLLLAGFSWMLQMWVREGQQICICGTLHSFLSSSLWLHALVHALVWPLHD